MYTAWSFVFYVWLMLLHSVSWLTFHRPEMVYILNPTHTEQRVSLKHTQGQDIVTGLRKAGQCAWIRHEPVHQKSNYLWFKKNNLWCVRPVGSIDMFMIYSTEEYFWQSTLPFVLVQSLANFLLFSELKEFIIYKDIVWLISCVLMMHLYTARQLGL